MTLRLLWCVYSIWLVSQDLLFLNSFFFKAVTFSILILSMFSFICWLCCTYLLSAGSINLSSNGCHQSTLLFFGPWNSNLLLFSSDHFLFGIIFALFHTDFMIKFLLIDSSIRALPSIYQFIFAILLYFMISACFVLEDFPCSSFETLLSKWQQFLWEILCQIIPFLADFSNFLFLSLFLWQN